MVKIYEVLYGSPQLHAHKDALLNNNSNKLSIMFLVFFRAIKMNIYYVLSHIFRAIKMSQTHQTGSLDLYFFNVFLRMKI